ncbi:hypothetical protein D3C71_1619660 [compost metagenome]
MTSTEAESGSAKVLQSGNTIWAKYDTSRNSRPPISATAMIACGMREVGLAVSSAMVETASKPTNDKHSTAAPVMINGTLKPS